MRQRATVEALLPGGRARLTVRRESACSGDCHQCAGCGAVAQTLSLTARNAIGARPGDRVWFESGSGPVLGAAALVYLLPLLCFLVGWFAASGLGAWAYAVGGGAFLLGTIPALLYDRRLKRRPPEYDIVEFVE